MIRVPHPEISVVIATFNRQHDLRRALDSVRRQDCQAVEIIVVDNASNDGTREMLAAEYRNVEAIPLDDNRGMDGYSEGFRRARGNIVFQMDNDSLMPDPDLLTRIIGIFGSLPPGVAVVATRVEECPGDASGVEEARSRDGRRGPLEDYGFHSGGVAFRKKVLDQVGGYSRDVFLYGSELFLQAKILAAGHRILYHPELLMLHKSSPVGRDRARGLYYEVRNRLWFLRTWGTCGQRWRFIPRMMLHDLAYGVHRSGLPAVLPAFRDGLLRLPADAPSPTGPGLEHVRSLVEAVGNSFTLTRIIDRARARR